MAMSAVQTVGRNTFAVFHTALMPGVTAWGVNKLCHAFFGVKPEIKKTPSFLIRQVSFITGAAVGVLLLQITPVANMAFDSTFVRTHGFSVIMGIFLTSTAGILTQDAPKPSAVFASIGILALTTPFVARYGQNALFPAIGIGAGIGSYL